MKTANFLLVLFAILLVGLFSGTVKTTNLEASNEYKDFFDILKLDVEIPNKNLFEKFAKKDDVKIKKDDVEIKIVTQEQPVTNQEIFIEVDDVFEKKNDEQIKIVKAIEKETKDEDNEIIIRNQDASIVNVNEVAETIDKAEETIKVAADTSSASITIDGETTLIPGSSNKNITYMQILQKPNDLDLNLKYAKQQGDIGNFKQTIATLERLNMLYSGNVEIKLYLLSVLVQADSPNKALSLIEEIKLISDLPMEDLDSVNEIEADLRDQGEPKLWNFYADLSIGGVHNENVNSVSKTRLKDSSDSRTEFTTPQFDRTYSEGLGLTATRSVGEGSSMMFNLNLTASQQDVETTDNYETLGFMFAFDTTIGNQSVSPFLMISKSDYQYDAYATSFMAGFGNYFSINDAHSINYGYTYSDSKANQTSSYTTADETNAISQSVNLGHDFMINNIISTSTSLGYGESDAHTDTNDYENIDLSLRVNFAFPFAYISIGDALSWNEYSKKDTTINSAVLRADLANTFDVMFTKALGDFFPTIDPNRNLFFNFAYEKIISDSNLLNYDYIADSFSIGFTKSIHLNK